MRYDTRLRDALGIDKPILLAPMAGAAGVDLAVAVAKAGGLGSLPTAVLTPAQAEEQIKAFRAAIDAPVNVNFFCHTPPAPDPEREARWRARLAPFATEFGVDLPPPAAGARAPFDDEYCKLVERTKPAVVSFHFGLPSPGLVARVKAAGAFVLSSATIPEEARWLEANGCDAIIAQGAEAGGHRGMFLTDDISTQIGAMALTPLVVDAVKIPVISAGAIADARGVAAAFCLGASAVQIGTAFLTSPESMISAYHREVLGRGELSALTNVFTGRPARGIYNRIMREVGPMTSDAPEFPGATTALTPLRAKAPHDFGSLWSGQAAALSKPEPAAQKLERIWRETGALLDSF